MVTCNDVWKTINITYVQCVIWEMFCFYFAISLSLVGDHFAEWLGFLQEYCNIIGPYVISMLCLGIQSISMDFVFSCNHHVSNSDWRSVQIAKSRPLGQTSKQIKGPLSLALPEENPLVIDSFPQKVLMMRRRHHIMTSSSWVER